MKRILVGTLILLGVLWSTQSQAEFYVYNGDQFIGVLVDSYLDSSSSAQWIVYDPKTKLYFKYNIANMGSTANIQGGNLYYTTDNCSGPAYITNDNYNTVKKVDKADLFYTGGPERFYLNFKSYWDGSTCTDCSNNVMHFREAIPVPVGNVPMVSSYDLQWHIEYHRIGAVVIPLGD